MTRRTRQWGIALRVTGSLLKPDFQPDCGELIGLVGKRAGPIPVASGGS